MSGVDGGIALVGGDVPAAIAIEGPFQLRTAPSMTTPARPSIASVKITLSQRIAIRYRPSP